MKEKHQYLSLGTVKKSGEVKRTPVWFSQDDNKVFIFTDVNSWKVKRIRNNKNVEIASCNSSGSNLGEISKGTARIMDTNEFDGVEAHFKRKYGLMFRIFKFYGKIRKNESVYIEISE